MVANKGDRGGQAEAPAEAEDERGGVARVARLLGALTFISRLSGLARDIVISGLFGTSSGADAFFVAFRIPNLFRRVVAEGATSAAFVPVFTDVRVNEGDREATRAAAAVGGMAILGLAALTAAGMIWAEPVVSLFAPGFTDESEKFALTVALTRWTFPYLFLVGTAAWAMGTLHTFRRFAVPAYGPVLLNLSIIVAALTLVSRFEVSVYALVVGVAVGGFCQVAVQVPTLRGLGVRLREMWQPRHSAVRRVLGLIGAAVLGGAVYQVNVLIATIFASLLPDRSVSWLWYGDRVFEFPLGIIAVAVGTAALPTLSAQAKEGRLREMGESVEHALAITFALCIPATVGLYLLAPQVVALLFERGRFGPGDTAMTAFALKAYVPGLLGVGAVRVLTSAFYAMEKPRIPVYAALFAMVVNVVFGVALMGPPDPGVEWWGASLVAQAGAVLAIADLRHGGLALATGIAASANALVLWWWLRRLLPSMGLRFVARSAALHLGATLPMVGVLVVWERAVAPSLDGWTTVSVLGAVGLGGGAYLGAALAMGSAEIRQLLAMGIRRT